MARSLCSWSSGHCSFETWPAIISSDNQPRKEGRKEQVTGVVAAAAATGLHTGSHAPMNHDNRPLASTIRLEKPHSQQD